LLSLGTYLITGHGDQKNTIISNLRLANAVDGELDQTVDSEMINKLVIIIIILEVSNCEVCSLMVQCSFVTSRLTG